MFPESQSPKRGDYGSWIFTVVVSFFKKMCTSLASKDNEGTESRPVARGSICDNIFYELGILKDTLDTKETQNMRK